MPNLQLFTIQVRAHSYDPSLEPSPWSEPSDPLAYLPAQIDCDGNGFIAISDIGCLLASARSGSPFSCDGNPAFTQADAELCFVPFLFSELESGATI